jgi:hypothetical protein
VTPAPVDPALAGLDPSGAKSSGSGVLATTGGGDVSGSVWISAAAVLSGALLLVFARLTRRTGSRSR